MAIHKEYSLEGFREALKLGLPNIRALTINDLGCVLYVPLNKIEVGYVKDLSSQGNNGKVIGPEEVVIGEEYYLRWRKELIKIGGKALSFDGVDDYVDLGTPPSLYPSEITLMAWAKAKTLPNWGGIVTNKKEARYGLNLQMGTKENIASLVGDGTTWAYLKTAWTPAPDVWYHIAVTHKGVTNRLYVNGVLSASATLGLAYSEPKTKTVIGTFYYDVGGSYFFNGLIAEVRIYNRALSAEEIKEHYNLLKPIFK